MREKATKDPTIRWKDPKAWRCLSDEQRDIIDEWYADVSSLAEEEKGSAINLRDSAAVFAITPFACAYGLMNNPFGWRMLVDIVCAFLVYALIFCAFRGIYCMIAEQRGTDKMGVIVHVIAIFCSFLITALVLSLVNVI